MTIEDHIEKLKRLMEDHNLKLFSPELYVEVDYLVKYVESIVCVMWIVEDSEEDDVAGLA